MKKSCVQIDACVSRLCRIAKRGFYKMKAETFYFLLSFWFDDKNVIKRKTSDICMGKIVPYKKYLRNICLWTRNIRFIFRTKITSIKVVNIRGFLTINLLIIEEKKSKKCFN